MTDEGQWCDPGYCQLAEVSNYAKELKEKLAIAVEALERIAGVKGPYNHPFPETYEGYGAFAIVTSRAPSQQSRERAMSDDDLIRRGDALMVCGTINRNDEALIVEGILRALPAVQPTVSPDVTALVEAAEKLLDAYSAIVGAGNPWGDELRAALARMKG